MASEKEMMLSTAFVGGKHYRVDPEYPTLSIWLAANNGKPASFMTATVCDNVTFMVECDPPLPPPPVKVQMPLPEGKVVVDISTLNRVSEMVVGMMDKTTGKVRDRATTTPTMTATAPPPP